MKRRLFLLLPLLAAGIASAALTPIDVQTFVSTGVWTKPFGARFVQVTCIGAGGGGRDSTSGWRGATATATFDAADLNATEIVAIGIGTIGENGGNSSFGNKLSALGGGNGGGGVATSAGASGK